MASAVLRRSDLSWLARNSRRHAAARTYARAGHGPIWLTVDGRLYQGDGRTGPGRSAAVRNGSWYHGAGRLDG